MKLSLLFGIFPPHIYDTIVSNSTGGIQYAADALQKSIIAGLGALDVDFNIFNLPFVGSYPKRFSESKIGNYEFSYDIQETKFWVLPLTLQPFVENAVKHGVLPLKQGGTLWISSRKTKSGVEVEIKDNGVGFDTRKFWSELDNTKSVGMKSAIYRLESEMGAACKIKSSQKSGESGTCILIQIPERK
jgi:hypothetical protein